jgi:hypothetical protein
MTLQEPPISSEELRALFDWLDRPNPPPCDHSLRETRQFLESRQLPVEPTLAWLKEYGGFCDCEVIFNVTDKWGERIGWQPKGKA